MSASRGIAAGALGAGLVYLASIDPNPKRKLAEGGAGLALLGFAGWQLKGLLSSWGLNSSNPVLGPGGPAYVAAYVGGIPGDVARVFQPAPPQPKAGQTKEELNNASLDWLWEVTQSSKPRR